MVHCQVLEKKRTMILLTSILHEMTLHDRFLGFHFNDLVIGEMNT